jgi:hypothetical protein
MDCWRSAEYKQQEVCDLCLARLESIVAVRATRRVRDTINLSLVESRR